MSFFPQFDFSQLIGLAVFGFFTGLGSTFGIDFSKYLIDKARENARKSLNLVQNHKRKEET